MPSKILVADDNPVVRTALRHLLQDSNSWEIVEAVNGQEAISTTVELRPDLVILDLVMPVMDGLTAAREISRILPEVPLLMCTMHTSRQLEAEARKFGVRGIVSKADSSLLLSLVQQLLAAKPAEPVIAAEPLIAADPAVISSISPKPVIVPPIPDPAAATPSDKTTTLTEPEKEVPQRRRCG
jgi:DNA-binding NarL/FixJ family response regulator